MSFFKGSDRHLDQRYLRTVSALMMRTRKNMVDLKKEIGGACAPAMRLCVCGVVLKFYVVGHPGAALS